MLVSSTIPPACMDQSKRIYIKELRGVFLFVFVLFVCLFLKITAVNTSAM